MSRLELSGFGVFRGRYQVVHDLELEVPAGKIVAMLGPNGAGKTSTMFGVLGILPSNGTRRLLGSAHLTPRERQRLGFVPQEGGIPSGATAGEWLELQARIKGATDLPEVMGLLEVPTDRRLARRLSGGERRRVALVAALIGRPELLVLDEPTAGLDPELRAVAVSAIRAAASRGAGILLSTHLLDEVIECADEVVVMRQGRIVRRGTPTSLLGDNAWSPGQQAEQLKRLFGDA